MAPFLGARELLGRAELNRAVRGLLRGGRWGGLKGHGEAKLFELGDETACSPFRILAFGEVVLTHVLIHLAGVEQVPDQLDQRVRDRDGRLVRSAAAGDLPVLRAEVAVLGACRGPARLEQRAAQPLVAAGGANRTALTGRLVTARAQADPGREIAGGREAGSCRHRSRR